MYTVPRSQASGSSESATGPVTERPRTLERAWRPGRSCRVLRARRDLSGSLPGPASYRGLFALRDLLANESFAHPVVRLGRERAHLPEDAGDVPKGDKATVTLWHRVEWFAHSVRLGGQLAEGRGDFLVRQRVRPCCADLRLLRGRIWRRDGDARVARYLFPVFAIIFTQIAIWEK